MNPEGMGDGTTGPDEMPPVRIPITGELDLHTFQPRDIASLLDSYLAECARASLREVRIVHGKGTGTLRETVHAWLRRSPRVAGFRLGDEHTGSWGATLVALRPDSDIA
jgi:DNA-nicking Smr family endonuclease